MEGVHPYFCNEGSCVPHSQCHDTPEGSQCACTCCLNGCLGLNVLVLSGTGCAELTPMLVSHHTRGGRGIPTYQTYPITQLRLSHNWALAWLCAWILLTFSDLISPNCPFVNQELLLLTDLCMFLPSSSPDVLEGFPLHQCSEE